jgi:hypothetical protein
LEKAFYQDLAGGIIYENVQTIGPSAAELIALPSDLPDVFGLLALSNEGAHEVLVTTDQAQEDFVTRVPAGRAVCFCPNSKTFYAKAWKEGAEATDLAVLALDTDVAA